MLMNNKETTPGQNLAQLIPINFTIYTMWQNQSPYTLNAVKAIKILTIKGDCSRS